MGGTKGILATLLVCVVTLIFAIEGGWRWLQGSDCDMRAACIVVHIY